MIFALCLCFERIRGLGFVLSHVFVQYARVGGEAERAVACHAGDRVAGAGGWEEALCCTKAIGVVILILMKAAIILKCPPYPTNYFA